MKKFPLVVAVVVALLASMALLQYPTNAQAAPDKTDKAVAKKQTAAGPAGLKIFSLRHADAKLLTLTLQPLFQGSQELRLITVFDERTNTIIARGPESELEILELVLLRLDEPTEDERAK